MAQKAKKWEEYLSLRGEAAKVVSYADYFTGKPLFSSLQIKNGAETAAEGVSLTIENENGILLPVSKDFEEIPFESVVNVELGNILSPAYFSSLEALCEEKIVVRLWKDKKAVAAAEWTVTALPFDFWQGVDGDNALLAAFVRPRLADCITMQSEVAAQLKKWNVKCELGGYVGNDKNAVRHVLAALFACLRKASVQRKDADISQPVKVGDGVTLLSSKESSAAEMALFVCGCLESMGFHPVLVLGAKEITCGVWLYDNCFLDTVSDDTQRLSAYVSDGINNLACFDVEDLFSDKNASYSTSETHFKEKLADGNYYDRYVDVRRCRASHVLPLPLRARSVKGYEILNEENAAPDSAPTLLRQTRSLKETRAQTKDKQWERRLLDLSMKNALLSFSPTKSGVQIVSANVDETQEALTKSSELRLAAATNDVLSIAKKGIRFGTSAETKRLRELISLENKAGILRTYLEQEALNETVGRLVKRNKEADEESGAKILYLAFGFLKWHTRAEKAEHFAPLVLQPVTVKKNKGNAEYTLSVNDEEFLFNATLLEYLKQEFGVDIRGLESAINGLKISEILAMVRAELVKLRGFEVYDDVYLATLSFSRYQMWNDLRQNIAEFSKNEIVKAFLDNAVVFDGADDCPREDETRPDATLTPLPADESQWEAIALSQTGKSFVLHGPPGTGKSQTITNMIANALNDGRRVLFVAEKQAALSVVKKRLDSLGLGDFCLELHSNKTNKTDVLQKLQSTLSLAGSAERVSLGEKATNILKVKEELAEPVTALHKKRRLGVSIYEALLVCLKNKNTPELMNIESTFYDSLTKEKIDTYKRMMSTAAVAAKECGGVHNSPFSNVNLTEYSPAVRDELYCAAEVVIAEIKHLKNYIGLFLELYRQKISTVTESRLAALAEIAEILQSSALKKYYGESEEDFNVFFNANKRLDGCLESYFKYYKKLIELSDNERRALNDCVDFTVAMQTDKYVRAVVKRLQKTANGEYAPQEIVSHLQTLCDIYTAMDCIKSSTSLSQYFTFAFGRVDFFDARKSFLKELYRLHELCATVFMDYNADSFNSMCIRAASGYSKPVLSGLAYALKSFEAAKEGFLNAANANRGKIPQEDVLGYYTAKAGALIENMDMLAPWCMYKKTAQALEEAGLTFITDALENGSVTSENVIDSFEKNVYKNYLQTNIPLDPSLSRFSAALCEEKSENLRLLTEEFARMTKESIRAKLISRLPSDKTEGALCVETANFTRLAKSNLRGMGLRKLFEEIPELMKVVAPCMLMSPITVSQYLKAENGSFDLVIFDEASQIPTAEAICSLARGKAAVIVGDPKQLPPTAFFQTNYVDEENLENEDMESVLDDCLAINMPQKYLTWHYRSKHESLIAFSNLMYYEGKLCTFPSPDALASKVRFVLVENGVYERGLSKRNKAEGDALIAEVLRRLSDKQLQKSSMGIVTFSNVQKEYIERKLTAAIAEKHLEREAYEREEPLFVKNLENVQGDERDVVLFSVCYGPDSLGRVSLNFGPLNQAGGWRRLNVAVSRAREEMVVFASMTGGMIDLSKTNSKGVAGLKAFLDFAQKGRTNLAISSKNLSAPKVGLGKYIAEELSSYGYDCRFDVGVSDFKIDVAVVDPKNRNNFILAILCDTPNDFSVQDRNVLQVQTLKRNNWNVLRLFSVNYYNNPKREIKKVKDLLDKLTGADKRGGTELNRAKKNYRAAALTVREENAAYVTSGDNDKEIIARLKAIVTAEEPISYDFLVRRCLTSLGIVKYGAKVEGRMQALIALCGFKYEHILGKDFYHKTEKAVAFDRYRVETGNVLRKQEYDFTPYEIVALVKSALEDKVALYMEELQVIVASLLKVAKPTERFTQYVNDCVLLGEEKGLFVRSVSDRISLA